jgi:hypothetical protein
VEARGCVIVSESKRWRVGMLPLFRYPTIFSALVSICYESQKPDLTAGLLDDATRIMRGRYFLGDALAI